MGTWEENEASISCWEKLHGYLLLQQLLEQSIIKNSVTACFAGRRTCSAGSCGISAVLGAVGASSGHSRGDSIREKSTLV